MDNGRLAVVSIRSAFRVDGPFEDSGEPRSRLRRLQARRRQGERNRGGGGRYLFSGRFSRVRDRSKAGGLYRGMADCLVPIVVFVLLFKRWKGCEGELDGIGRVIRQRLRRRYQAAEERQHVEKWFMGACSPRLARETGLCGRGWNGRLRPVGTRQPEGCNTRDRTGLPGAPAATRAREQRTGKPGHEDEG